ncbi:MAG TPA: MarR family transcriptional regulator [Gaiellaceae bacterium]|nr:MarR family transcriptional regulator [Gaiellaceae bacterium]
MKEDEQDHVDRWLASHELPGAVDREVEGIVDRINGIRRRLSRMLDETLADHDLSEGEWKALGHLQLDGAPHRKPVGQLARWADLSSGAMTNRIDRLEKAGFVRRLPDPDDRRGVLVELTDEGRRAWEESVSAQAAKESLVAAALTAEEKKQLNALLRWLMLEFERRESERK